MADSGFDFSMVGRLDASGIASGANQAAGALGQVERAQADVAKGAGDLAAKSAAAERAQAQLAREAQELREKLDPVAAAQRKVNDELAKAQRLLDAGAISAREFAQVQALADRALKAGTTSIGAQRQAYQQLGFQVQDIVSTLSLGINPLVVLAQQGGQTAAALSGFGGTVGRVATFMAGPWGSAILGATTVLGLMIPALLNAGDAADSMASQQDVLARFVDRTTGKIRDQIVAVQALAAAQAEGRRRQEQEADYLKNRAALVNAARTGSSPAVTTVLPGVGPVREQGGISERGGAQVRALVAEYERGVRSANELAVAIRKVAETDPSVRRLAGTVTVLASRTVDSAQAYQKTAATIRVLTGSATDADRKLLGFKDSTDKVNTSLVETQARVATATGALEKAQANLDLVRQKGREAVKAGTLDEKAYQSQVEEAMRAVNAAEAAQKAATAGTRAANKEKREAAKATREAAAAERELESSLDSLARKYLPLLAAERARRAELEQIAKLVASGKLTGGEAEAATRAAYLAEFDAGTKAWDDQVKATFDKLPQLARDGLDKPLTEITNRLDDNLERTSAKFWADFGNQGASTVEALGNALGGKFGGIIEQLGAIAGNVDGRPVGGGGTLGGIVNALSRGPIGQDGKPGLTAFGRGFAEFQGQFKNQLDGLFNKVFGEGGIFGGTLGQTLGKAFAGAQLGGATGKPITNLLGIKGSNTGAQLGGALGGAVGGPLGSFIGGVIGSAVGGLFKSTPKASATVTGAGGQVTAGQGVGSKSLVGAATGLGSSVASGLNQIAEALNATIGNFAVSVGVRDKNFRVDPTGRGITKTKKGAIDYGQDEGAAILGAIGVAIGQGAIQGVSQAVQSALKSSTDVEVAIKEALKVQEVEDILAGVSDGVRKMLRDFDRQAAERVRVARQYGFDVVAIEQKNAADRKAIIEESLQSTVGSLQTLLQEFATGDLFEGDAATRRARIQEQITKVYQEALAGKAGAADTLAGLYRQLTTTSKEAFGTAGGEYGADRTLAQTGAQAVIDAERKRIDDAAANQAKATQNLERQTALGEEANGFLSQQTTYLEQIRNFVQRGSFAPATGGFNGFGFDAGTLLDRNARPV